MRRRAVPRRRAPPSPFLAVVALLAAVAPVGFVPGGSVGGGTIVGLATGSNCNAVGSSTPSALRIPLAVPASAIQAGGSLSVGFEAELQNYSGSSARVYFPSLFASFPRSPSGTLTVYFSPRNISLAPSTWSPASFASRVVILSSATSFRSGATALLSSQLLAVMATAGYGNLTLAVRWHWTVTQPGGASLGSGWSVPSARPASGLPSLFYPAPYVALVSRSGSTMYVGANFTMALGGAVAGRSFLVELEFPNNGSVVQATRESSAASATRFTAWIVLLNYDSYLIPTTYLVHLHDDCGAMLYSLSVRTAFAPNATITFHLRPSSCGAIDFNGVNYTDGSQGRVRPSSTPYTFSLPSCAGHSFSGWATTGGLHITSASGLQVSSNGTFAVSYS